MRNFKKLSKTLLVATALTGVMATTAILPGGADFVGSVASAQDFPLASPERAAAAAAANKARPKLKSTKGMTERPAKKLAKVQEFMNSEPPNYPEAMALLKGQNLEKLNTTEKASFYQLMAAVAQNQGNMDEALSNYKNILAMDSISNAQRDQMTFIVGQIEFSNGNLDTALNYFNEWFKYQEVPSMTNIVMLANVHYAAGLEDGVAPAEAEKHFRQSVEFLNWAITKAKAEGKEDKENWYAVLRALHNNLEEMDKQLVAQKSRLVSVIEENQQAHTAAGHWGVPTCAFQGEAFFGQDRLDVLLWRLKKEGLAKR